MEAGNASDAARLELDIDDARPPGSGTFWTPSAQIITAVIGSGVLSLASAIAPQIGSVAGPAVTLPSPPRIMTATGLQVDGTDATVIDMGGVMDQLAQIVSTGASPPTQQLVRALWLVSSLTLVVDVSAALYQPAMGPVFGGHKIAYYGTLAGIFAVVTVEMATAYWLPRAGTQLASFAKALLRLAVLLLLLVVALGGYAVTVKI